MISQSEDLEDRQPNEKTSDEPVVQKKTADCAEPQSRYGSPVEESISSKYVVQTEITAGKRAGNSYNFAKIRKRQ